MDGMSTRVGIHVPYGHVSPSNVHGSLSHTESTIEVKIDFHNISMLRNHNLLSMLNFVSTPWGA